MQCTLVMAGEGVSYYGAANDFARRSRPCSPPQNVEPSVGAQTMTEPPPLRVGAALPDPPFEFATDAGPDGFDIVLLQNIARRLGRTWQLVPYTGSDFNGIFAGLESGLYDCVASGATITPEREQMADFCAPYAISGQSLVVDRARHSQVHDTNDLHGLTIGVQRGNTSQPVAERLVAQGYAARVRIYAYNQIETALDDLSTGGCDAFMKLAPVTHWFTRNRPALSVVQTGITRERLGISVRKGNATLLKAINEAQIALTKDGTLPALIAKWLGNAAEPA